MLLKINIGVLSVFEKAYRILKEKPAAYYPFIAVAATEIFVLLIILVAPRAPFDRFLAPPIRAFWGERYLHFPAHYVLLAYLFFLSQLWISIFLGSLASGISVGFLRQGRKPKVFEPLLSALKKYLSLIGVTLFASVTLFVFSRTTTWFAVRAGVNGSINPDEAWLAPALILFRFIITIVVHAFLAYAIPAIIIENAGLPAALRRSIRVCSKRFGETLVMVGFPMVTLFPIIMFQNRPIYIIDRLFPEAVFLICVANVLVSSLFVAPVITAAATALLVEEKK